MLDEFFRRAKRPYAGLKTIPGFHRECSEIANRNDIQFITLMREDFLSCTASCIVSDRRFQWEKPSRDQSSLLNMHGGLARGHRSLLLRAAGASSGIRCGAVRLILAEVSTRPRVS